jgi:hypothetical protein
LLAAPSEAERLTVTAVKVLTVTEVLLEGILSGMAASNPPATPAELAVPTPFKLFAHRATWPREFVFPIPVRSEKLQGWGNFATPQPLVTRLLAVVAAPGYRGCSTSPGLLAAATGASRTTSVATRTPAEIGRAQGRRGGFGACMDRSTDGRGSR